MNRRDFFKYAVAAGAVLALPSDKGIWTPPPPVIDPIPGTEAMLRVGSVYLMTELFIYGFGHQSRRALWTLRRQQDGPVLMDWHLNVHGGTIYWQAGVDLRNAIVFVPGSAPVIECNDLDVDWHVRLRELEQTERSVYLHPEYIGGKGLLALPSAAPGFGGRLNFEEFNL